MLMMLDFLKGYFMQHKKFCDSELFKSKVSETYEYKIDDKDIDFCIFKLNGRFPIKGFCYNQICKEMSFVVKGKGILCVENKIYNLKKNDAVLINPNEKYYFKGKMVLAISCSPAYDPKQHKEIDDLKKY